MKTIVIVAGTRPNFVKVAPIIRAIKEYSKINYLLVHTGQHYDHNMSRLFFEQLGIPEPDINLGAGGGTQAQQTGSIMIGFEKFLSENPCSMVLVVGDVNSTMACAIVAKKMGIKVAHVEAGIRSNDWSMPEEVNRVVTDSISNYFFTTSEFANQNLRLQGVPDSAIFYVGNVMIDSLLHSMNRLIEPVIWQELSLQSQHYLMLTLHRPSNVDDSDTLATILATIDQAVSLPVIFPVHPRTRNKLTELKATFSKICIVDPQPYLEFIYLLKHSRGIITDSGGITEEATVLGVPCITLRENTERPETVFQGTNVLVGSDMDALKTYLRDINLGQWKHHEVPDLWDGKTAERIASLLDEIVVELA